MTRPGFRIFETALVIFCMFIVFSYSGLGDRSQESVTDEISIFDGEKKTIRLWYTDDALTDYLTVRAVEYNKGSRSVRVEPVLKDAIGILEEVARASVEEDAMPDLYIISNDMLEKAYLAGLACEIDDGPFIEDEESGFGAAARNAVSFRGKYVGYPFYFETSSLLYNRTYLEQEALAELRAELEAAEAEESAEPEEEQDEDYEMSNEEADRILTEGDMPSDDDEADDLDDRIPLSEIQARWKSMLPGTISEILSFADSYNAPEQVEAVFKWDVNDIFYNYFFVGGYMNIGGASGDDPEQIDIYNESTLDCMSIYQQLRSFFAIDEKEVTYNSVMQDFIDGRIVFTVATTDSIERIEKAKAEGLCDFDYGVTVMPGLTPGYRSRTMSVTEAIVVNGYSEEATEANSFARYLCSDSTDNLYRMTGKMASHAGIDYGNDSISSFLYVYDNSVPVTKLLEISDFWVRLEIAFAEIWDGADVNQIMRDLSETTMRQVTSSQYHEELLPDPEILFNYNPEEESEEE